MLEVGGKRRWCIWGERGVSKRQRVWTAVKVNTAENGENLDR